MELQDSGQWTWIRSNNLLIWENEAQFLRDLISSQALLEQLFQGFLPLMFLGYKLPFFLCKPLSLLCELLGSTQNINSIAFISFLCPTLDLTLSFIAFYTFKPLVQVFISSIVIDSKFLSFMHFILCKFSFPLYFNVIYCFHLMLAFISLLLVLFLLHLLI